MQFIGLSRELLLSYLISFKKGSHSSYILIKVSLSPLYENSTTASCAVAL